MSQQKGTLWVCIIGYDKSSLRRSKVCLIPIIHIAAHHQFEYLSGLAAWCRTHIKDCMLCFYAEEKWWKHADYLLSGQNARVIGLLNKLMDGFQPKVLLEEFPWDSHLIEDVTRRVVFLCCKLHLREVEALILEILLIYSNFS